MSETHLVLLAKLNSGKLHCPAAALIVYILVSGLMETSFKRIIISLADLGGPSTSVGCMSGWYSGGCGFDPSVQQHSFVEIGHEIISTAILSLPLIQVRQLSVTGEKMCTKYWLST